MPPSCHSVTPFSFSPVSLYEQKVVGQVVLCLLLVNQLVFAVRNDDSVFAHVCLLGFNICPVAMYFPKKVMQQCCTVCAK